MHSMHGDGQIERGKLYNGFVHVLHVTCAGHNTSAAVLFLYICSIRPDGTVRSHLSDDRTTCFTGHTVTTSSLFQTHASWYQVLARRVQSFQVCNMLPRFHDFRHVTQIDFFCCWGCCCQTRFNTA